MCCCSFGEDWGWEGIVTMQNSKFRLLHKSSNDPFKKKKELEIFSNALWVQAKKKVELQPENLNLK